MDSTASSLIKPTLDDKIAKLREPVRLRSDVLPRFVLILLECALHSFLCSFAACLEEWFRQYRAGHFEPWPDDEDAAVSEPRRSRYKMKFPPAAPKARAGAKPVRIAAEAAPEPGCAASAAVRLPAAVMLPQRWAGRSWAPIRPLPASLRLLSGDGCRRWSDRCKVSKIFRAGGGLGENCA